MPRKAVTPKTPAAKYKTIDRAGLSVQALSVLDALSKETKRFTSMTAEQREKFNAFYKTLKEKKPQAIKGTPEYRQAKKEREPQKPQTPKEVRTKVKGIREALKDKRIKNFYKGTSKTSLEIDSKRGGHKSSSSRGAKPVGWRFRGDNYRKPTRADIRAGRAYYESRPNRSDIRRSMPLLEHGGELEKKKIIVDGRGNKWYLTYIDSTHFFMGLSPDDKGNPWHIGQIRNEPYYNEVNEWLLSHNISTSNSLKHYVLNEMSDGSIASKTGVTNYKDIDAIRITAFQILERDGDRPFSIRNATELMREAAMEWKENESGGHYADGGVTGGKNGKKSDLDKLLIKREKVSERYERERDKNNKKFADIPFGYGMRSYSRLKNFSTRREDELYSQLKEIDSEIKTLSEKSKYADGGVTGDDDDNIVTLIFDGKRRFYRLDPSSYDFEDSDIYTDKKSDLWKFMAKELDIFIKNASPDVKEAFEEGEWEGEEFNEEQMIRANIAVISEYIKAEFPDKKVLNLDKNEVPIFDPYDFYERGGMTKEPVSKDQIKLEL